MEKSTLEKGDDFENRSRTIIEKLINEYAYP